ncbi:MAG: aspartyl/glutamyl-tRNA amidotransferase subunit C [Spirochaetaceae bacterium]|jgi:aspartyl-tRNA(Asn)/glutamyl-tRNA(Gln) amidotransferase subunit C|nr:aspartyl/glutamyl-tRNA amidotransferase subunit C [Spirochaetaceae bacterium]
METLGAQTPIAFGIEDLRETAALARLNLSEEEINASLGAFSEMLSYFAAMQEADSDTAAFGKNLSEVHDERFAAASGHFRPDEPHPQDVRTAEKILSLAAETDGRFIVMPNVL